ncbi:MAG: hypothetical protein JXR96_19475 [Deltaproteobacteria bacterium]|nr:hypothetical protein [Deltaproteobacteria bacterium]
MEAELEDLDQKIDKLRSVYELYFQGIEKREPNLEREAFKRRLRALRRLHIRNTALKFRLNQLVAKSTIYENYWNRIARQIEEGTYHRDVYKAKYRAQLKEEMLAERGGTPEPDRPDRQEQPAAAEPGRQERPAAAAAATPTSTAARPRSRRPSAEQGGLSDDKLDALYNAYRTAKQRCRENVKGLSRESLASTLDKQVPAIMKQYKCRSVEFKVVIKQGKAILKAVPKF